MGWGQDPSVSLDRVASYTNYGHKAVGLAGPGGDFVLPGNEVCSRPRLPTGTVLQFCWALDMVMSTTRGAGASISSYGWAAGTSMAAPAAAGVAALIIGKYGTSVRHSSRRGSGSPPTTWASRARTTSTVRVASTPGGP